MNASKLRDVLEILMTREQVIAAEQKTKEIRAKFAKQ